MFRVLIIALRAVICTMEAVLLARVICEFKGVNRDTMPFKFLLSLSEPLLETVRKMLNQDSGRKLTIDVSPFLVMIVLYAVYGLLK
ncbi:MAG: hypothetical protein GXX10_05590 [Clostridiaceae bacterium]|nr:hypothetical protein [Clostridiaceae bacterium]